MSESKDQGWHWYVAAIPTQGDCAFEANYKSRDEDGDVPFRRMTRIVFNGREVMLQKWVPMAAGQCDEFGILMVRNLSFLTDASKTFIEKLEEIWGIRKIQVPNSGIVLPPGTTP